MLGCTRYKSAGTRKRIESRIPRRNPQKSKKCLLGPAGRSNAQRGRVLPGPPRSNPTETARSVPPRPSRADARPTPPPCRRDLCHASRRYSIGPVPPAAVVPPRRGRHSRPSALSREAAPSSPVERHPSPHVRSRGASSKLPSALQRRVRPPRCPPRRAPPPPCRPLGGDKQAACARAASSDPLSLAGVSVASVAPQWSRRSTRGRGAARHSIPANTTQPAGGGLRGGGGGTPPGRPASPRLGAPAEPGMSPPDFCGGPGTGAGSPLPWRPPTPFPAPPPAARAFPSWSSQSRRPASLNAVRGIAFSSGPPCSPPFLQSASGPARSRARPSALCAGAVAILAAGVRDDRLGRSSGPLRRASDVEHGSGKIISPDPSPVLGLLPLAPSPPPRSRPAVLANPSLVVYFSASPSRVSRFPSGKSCGESFDKVPGGRRTPYGCDFYL